MSLAPARPRAPSSPPPLPLFDTPEFPTLRRVKPLPKRWLHSPSLPHTHLDLSHPNLHLHPHSDPPDLNPNFPAPADLGPHVAALLEGLHLPGPGASAEELLAHAEALSARIGAQSYYMPLLAGSAGTGEGGGGTGGTPGEGVGGFELDLYASLARASVSASASVLMDVAPAHGPTQLAHSTLPQTHTQLNQTLHHHAHPDDADADGEGEGEYIDHLQQPGNTKKRKVPGVRSGSGGLAHGESDELALAHRELHHTQPETAAAPSPGPIGEAPRTTQQKTQRRRSKLARAALAGLQHKELLRTRKRQLAAVLGALSHGDTLALDQALSASFASLGAGPGGSGIGGGGTNNAGGVGGGGRDGGGVGGRRVRLSRRRTVRMQRAVRRLPRHPDQAPFPLLQEFGFACESATADRLIATKEEVASLRKRFEAELARQASKAAKMSSRSLGSGSNGAGTSGKGGKNRRRARGTKGSGGGGGGGGGVGATATIAGGEQPAEFLDPATGQIVVGGVPGALKPTVAPHTGYNNYNGSTQTTGTTTTTTTAGTTTTTTTTNTTNTTTTTTNTGSQPGSGGVSKTKGGKKKKRSALANASNPHHLRNYVPSRLPHSAPPSAGGDDLLSPLPLRFLSATSKKSRGGAGVQLTNPADEWICAFCEYSLFYGGDDAGGGYRRAVRARKKILKRRRRARERAAAAASGSSTAVRAPVRQEEEEDGEDGEGEYEESDGDLEEEEGGDGGRGGGGRGGKGDGRGGDGYG